MRVVLSHNRKQPTNKMGAQCWRLVLSFALVGLVGVVVGGHDDGNGDDRNVMAFEFNPDRSHTNINTRTRASNYHWSESCPLPATFHQQHRGDCSGFGAVDSNGGGGGDDCAAACCCSITDYGVSTTEYSYSSKQVVRINERNRPLSGKGEPAFHSAVGCWDFLCAVALCCVVLCCVALDATRITR